MIENNSLIFTAKQATSEQFNSNLEFLFRKPLFVEAFFFSIFALFRFSYITEKKDKKILGEGSPMKKKIIGKKENLSDRKKDLFFLLDFIDQSLHRVLLHSIGSVRENCLKNNNPIFDFFLFFFKLFERFSQND